MKLLRRVISGIQRRLNALPPIQFLHRVISAVALILCSIPLKCLSFRLRAEAIESATDDMIVREAIPCGFIRFFVPNPLLITRARAVLTKEADTIRWIDGFSDNDVLWDIGANVGVYSLYAAIQKRISVVAFEPSATNYYVLTRNIELNSVSDRIVAFCIALSDQTHAGFINLASPTMGAALGQFGKRGEMSPYLMAPSRAVAHGMLGFSIDDFMAQFNPPFPNHLKLDVDGLELSILKGCILTLNDPRLKSVLVEMKIDDSEEKRHAVEMLRSAGFSLTGQGEIQGTQTERLANHIFEKRLGAEKALVPTHRSANELQDLCVAKDA